MKLMQTIGQINLYQVGVVVNKFKNSFLLASVFSLLLVFFPTGAKAQMWIYKSIYQPDKMFFIEKNAEGFRSRDSFGTGDVFEEALFCSEKQAFHCIDTRGVHFSVPKGKLSLHQSWTRNDILYQITAMTSDSILGVKGDIFIITTDMGIETPEDVSFWYSPHHGLVAIGGKSTDTAGFYALEGQCGFAADPLCAKEVLARPQSSIELVKPRIYKR